MTDQLRQWCDFWEKHFHYDGDWDTPENRDEWAQWGERIAAVLRAEIADFADLSVELDWTL